MRMKGADFAATDYPREYRMVPQARWVTTGVGLIMVLLGVVRIALDTAHMGIRGVPVGDFVAEACFAAFTVWMGFFVSRRVILLGDGVEVVSWFSRRRLMRKELRGYRMGRVSSQAGGGSYYN
jgi:hypothetical protein